MGFIVWNLKHLPCPVMQADNCLIHAVDSCCPTASIKEVCHCGIKRFNSTKVEIMPYNLNN